HRNLGPVPIQPPEARPPRRGADGPRWPPALHWLGEFPAAGECHLARPAIAWLPRRSPWARSLFSAEIIRGTGRTGQGSADPITRVWPDDHSRRCREHRATVGGGGGTGSQFLSDDPRTGLPAG